MAFLWSVVPLKFRKNHCKLGETHRKTLSICKITTLYRVNFAEDKAPTFQRKTIKNLNY
jgi:hypothetical protein